MADLQGIKGIPTEPQLRKPSTYTDYLEGLKGRIFKESVMEPGFIDSLTAPEGSPIDHQNISSVAGGRIREMFVDPMKRYADVIDRGMKGEIGRENLTIQDQLTLIEGQIDTTIGGLFQHGMSKGGFDPNTLHMFVGPKAKDIVKAEKMAMRGASPAEIQSKLLMHKKPDGMWRKEISDAEMSLDPSGLDVKYPAYPDFEQGKLGDVVKHPELYSETPELKDLSFQLRQDGPASMEKGSFSGDILNINQDSPARRIAQSKYSAGSYTDEFIDKMAKELVEDGDAPDYATGKKWMENARDKHIAKAQGIGKFEEGVPKTVGHELQHAVQQKEGWDRGGSPEQFETKIKNQITAKANLIEFQEKMLTKYGDDLDLIADQKRLNTEIDDLLNQLGTDEPFKQYQNLLGEREARSTAERLGMSLEERRVSLPDVGEGATVLMR